MTAAIVTTGSGKLQEGPADASGVHCFRGIPYARPPVADLRWRPPQPVEPWTGVRKADTFGPNALQGIVFNDIDPLAAGVSEDCLYLNIWTPALNPAEAAPVMVWIHGGGFVVGSGAEPRYDGTNLARRGIVVVTVNHRLNALGFLAHPELTAESPNGASGNYGLLDLIAALHWVRSNIHAFGGDPDQVTLAGESAGSEAVCALMASPLAKGLFHRAIGQSGAMFPTPTRRPMPLAEAEQAGLAFMHTAGASSLAELRLLPAEDILAAAPGLGFRPIVDGNVLPHTPAEIFADGDQSDVPLLAGWNRDEGFNFTLLQGENADRPYAELVERIFVDRRQDALGHYPGGSEEDDAMAARDLGGDVVIIHATWAWLEAQRESGQAPLYRFRFDRAPGIPHDWFEGRSGEDAGAFHAGEIIYVFNNLDAMPWRSTIDDQRVADWMSAYWVNFVKSGDPNGPDLPDWPSYRRDDHPFMVMDVAPEAQPDPHRQRHAFLAEVARDRM